jgi:hypothetical protein
MRERRATVLKEDPETVFRIVFILLGGAPKACGGKRKYTSAN